MKKVSIDQVQETAKELDIEQQKIEALAEKLRKDIEENEVPKEKNEKKQLIVIVNVDGLTEEQAKAVENLPMIVVEFPLEGDHTTILPNVCKASYDYNVTKKGMKHPVLKIMESLTVVQRKFFKAFDIGVKSKGVSLVLTTDNQIPQISAVDEDV
jgi:single-stranded DNA-specific DHH superfamily exonuclease